MGKKTVFAYGKVVAICEAIKSEKIGIIAASRILFSLRFDLDKETDEDFKFFVAIDSETDHLPTDWKRINWNIEVLKEKDKEVAEFESFYKDAAFTVYEKLIKRFKINSNKNEL